jgi:hypothetical protein
VRLPVQRPAPDSWRQFVAGPEVRGVHADDELIEALRGGHITAEYRDPVAALLAAWRASILDEYATNAMGGLDTAQRR